MYLLTSPHFIGLGEPAPIDLKMGLKSEFYIFFFSDIYEIIFSAKISAKICGNFARPILSVVFLESIQLSE